VKVDSLQNLLPTLTLITLDGRAGLEEPCAVLGPSPRSVSCLVSLNISGKQSLVTMFGEREPNSLGHQGAGKMLADVWLFDIESQTWKEIQIDDGSKPPARG
jgi:hypothetical protein